MGYSIVGHCPKCGAPIYAPSVWMAITPPPSQPSCNCNPSSQVEYRTNTGNEGKEEK